MTIVSLNDDDVALSGTRISIASLPLRGAGEMASGLSSLRRL